jgi:hypothetical protein
VVTTSEVPKDQSYVATVDAAGRATISITAGFKPWLVSQVSIEMLTAPAGSTCFLRKRGQLITPLISAGDAAGGDPAVMVYPGEALTVEWHGCTPGTQAYATAIYQIVEYG